jgi:predicted RNase H-like HicB family nuclease
LSFPVAANRNQEPHARSLGQLDGYEKSAMTLYVGILEGDGAGWSVRLPDVPGCHGAGATPEEALTDAISALRTVARLYAADGIKLNSPRDTLAIRADKDAEFDPDKETLVLLPAILETGRSAKASVSLDSGSLEAIDEAAGRRGMTRSAFLTRVALDAIEREAT